MTDILNLTTIQKEILSPKTIRLRTRAVYDQALQGKSHFAVHPEKLDAVVDFVLEVTQRNYPDGKIPVHGRYEHLRAGGIDRIGELQKKIDHLSKKDQARVLIDLVVLSVLLDAGAGPTWKFKEGSKEYNRSEGLAVASFRLFDSGALADNPAKRFAVTAQRLKSLTLKDLQKGMQVTAENPMDGLEGRLGLLNRLGDTLQAFPDLFGTSPRPGNLIDWIEKHHPKTIAATDILNILLIGFSKMWPARVTVDGLGLGDAWDYNGLQIPFHKLSQWLTYSLIEPIEASGIQVTGIEELTGLPEYRNGGLFIDMGVLELRDTANLTKLLKPSDNLIIEWRALTIQLLDELGNRVRKKLKKTEIELPLARILQGGTWSAGREIAKKLRSDGSPPLNLESDGTVF